MADIFNPIYTLDAGVIMAKLHLAGKSQATSFFVANSAVENEKPEDTAENPGKCRFNTDIKTGKFEIAFIHKVKPFEYFKLIKLEKFKEYKTYMDIKLHEAKNAQANNKNNKPITDKPDENTEGEENKEQRSPELLDIFKSLVNAVLKCFQKNKNLKIDENSTEEEVKNAITEENKARADYFKKLVEEIEPIAEKDIKNYFENFVGKEFYKNISLKSYVKRYFNEQATDMSKVTIKNFLVIGMSEKDLEKLEQEFLKDLSKPTVIRYGFVVAAELDPIE